MFKLTTILMSLLFASALNAAPNLSKMVIINDSGALLTADVGEIYYFPNAQPNTQTQMSWQGFMAFCSSHPGLSHSTNKDVCRITIRLRVPKQNIMDFPVLINLKTGHMDPSWYHSQGHRLEGIAPGIIRIAKD